MTDCEGLWYALVSTGYLQEGADHAVSCAALGMEEIIEARTQHATSSLGAGRDPSAQQKTHEYQVR